MAVQGERMDGLWEQMREHHRRRVEALEAAERDPELISAARKLADAGLAGAHLLAFVSKHGQ